VDHTTIEQALSLPYHDFEDAVQRLCMPRPHDSLNLPRSLGDELVLRLATPDDAQALAELNAHILLDEDEPPELVAVWTKDLLSGRHPTTSAADFTLVENTRTGAIVSSACLIPQVWAYEDIPFPVGRLELVGTDPDFRRQGLARAVFAILHDLSAAYGHLVQGVTGIPWFYRQFGYEYALVLGGSRDLHVDDVPELEDSQPEPYQIRRATEADIPALRRLYQRQCAGKLVTTVIDEARWRYDLSGHSPGSNVEYRAYCILDDRGCVVGYYSAPPRLWGSRIGVWELAVDDDVSLHTALPSVLRALQALGEAYAAQPGPEKKSLSAIRLSLGQEHPAYQALAAKLTQARRPYAWYIRVPDLPAFVRHIAPVLERRLADSVMRGYTGQLNINFYRGGLSLVFEKGQLSSAENWQAPLHSDQHWKGASFPPLTFLQLLFGYRSLDELQAAFPDCWASEEPGLLLNALFPKRTSWALPLG
jgi:GNAT superfamily N-acetyltransferase